MLTQEEIGALLILIDNDLERLGTFKPNLQTEEGKQFFRMLLEKQQQLQGIKRKLRQM